jgi:predicted transcriptional regulator
MNSVAESITNFSDGDEEEEGLCHIEHKLLKSINAQPGIRYRELLRLFGLTNGVLTYHISSLERSQQIIVDRNNKSKVTRYYTNYIPAEESCIIGHIRNDTARQIILCIVEHNNRLCTFNDIVRYTKRSPSTISWHLKRLRDAGIVVSVRYSGQAQYNGHCQYLYKVIDMELVTNVLSKYKESFADKVLNNYTEIIEDL